MQKTTELSDIIIIGAGPVGSYTARVLAGKGYNVTVLEKRSSLGEPVCCAGIISPDCFDQLDVNIPLANSFCGAQVYSPLGQVLELRRPSVQAVVIDRGLLDSAMAESASRSGATFKFGVNVKRIDIDDCGATVHAENNAVVHRGQVVIIATGFNPLFTTSLNLGSPDRFAVGVQARVNLASSQPLSIFTSYDFTPGFFSWVVPIENGTALAGLLSRKNAARNFKTFIKHLKDSGTIAAAEQPCYRGVNLSLLGRTYGQRMIVIGDAAGQVKPVTGGGILYGIKGAGCAIDTVEQAFEQGKFNAGSLSGYKRKLKKVLGRDIRLGQLARKAYEKLDECRIESAFSAAVKTGIVDKLSNDEQLKFDDHGAVMLRLMKTPAFYKMFGSILMPPRKNDYDL